MDLSLIEDKLKKHDQILEQHSDILVQLQLANERRSSDMHHMRESLDSITKSITELDNKVDQILLTPGRKWDKAGTVFITAVITAVMSFLLAAIGIK